MNESNRHPGFGDVPHQYDPEFKGSIWEQMEIYSDELCPMCKSHLNKKDGICLNGHHLSKETMDKFNRIFRGIG